jgi:CheY-like chemotaxis protein
VAEALAKYEAHLFGLVISDLGLPDGNGFDLVRQMISVRPTKSIALSGYGMEEDVRRGMEAGFSAQLTKPINLEQLELTIQRVLGQSLTVGRIKSNST